MQEVLAFWGDREGAFQNDVVRPQPGRKRRQTPGKAPAEGNGLFAQSPCAKALQKTEGKHGEGYPEKCVQARRWVELCT